MKFMTHRILLILLHIVSFVGFGQSNDTITYKNEASKKVRMVIMGDSLWLQNYESKKSLITYLNYEAMEVEGLAFYVGKTKVNGKELDVTIQFLDGSICTIDSENLDFNFRICKEESKYIDKLSPFGVEEKNSKRSDSNGSENQFETVETNTNGDFETGKGVFGNDEGIENGTEKIKRRIIVNRIIMPDYDVEFDYKLCLKLGINSDGDVVSAVCNKARSTFTDQKVIDDITSKIIQQMKYSKSVKTEIEYTFFTIQLISD